MDGSGSDTASFAATTHPTTTRPVAAGSVAAGPVGTLGRPPLGAFGAGILRPRARRTAVAVLLVFADLVAVEAAIHLVAALMATAGLWPVADQPDLVRAFALAAPVLMLLAHGCGLYDSHGPGPFERFRLRARVASVYFGAAAPMAALAPPLLVPLLIFAPAAALLTIAFGWWAETVLRRILTRRGLWAAPVVVLGCGAASASLAAKLLARPELGLRPVGFLDVGFSEDGEDRGPPPGTLPVLGTLGDAASLAPAIDGAVAPQAVAARLAAAGRFEALPFGRIVVVPDFRPLQTLHIGVRCLDDALGLEIRRDPSGRRQRRLKRALDLAVAIPLLVLAMPVIAMVAAAIKIVSPGSAFYTQRRVGAGGAPLLVPKLRSMYPDAERRLQEHLAGNPAARAEWDRYVKLTHDPRVLPLVGSFIRRASLDELPQLWNIVRGGMSLVGPRPFPTYHVNRFDADFQVLRTSVPPGLTGLWQVSSRSEGDLEKQKEQDSYYIRNWSLLLDFYILAETLPAVIFAKGAK